MRSQFLKLYIGCLSVFVSLVLCAQETTVVEGIRIDEERIEPSRSATVVNFGKDQQIKNQSVADILRSVPGLDVVRQGGVGQTTSIFIRGARSEDTLVLVDGMEVNDAMSPTRGFDFSNMSTDNIERIEIYRGPQSVRFGAGALGGVINIITKSGVGGQSESNYLIESGSYQTNRQMLSHLGQGNLFSYSFGVGRYWTQGFSAASERSGNRERDGAYIISGSAKLSGMVGGSMRVQSSVRYTESQVDIDSGGGSGSDDPNSQTQFQQLIVAVAASQRFFDENLKSTLGFYFSEVDRTGRNEPDVGNTTSASDAFLSENFKIQSENEFVLSDFSRIHFSLQWRDESGIANSTFNEFISVVDRRNQSIFGKAVTYLFEDKSWLFDVGVRSDQTLAARTFSSSRISLGRKFFSDETKIFVSYGTGFKLPSLYQLYSVYGDQNLKQEYANALEGTIEQKLAADSIALLTLFENKYRNLIDYNAATDHYFNLSRASSLGFEFQLRINNLIKDLAFNGTYAYLEAKDETTNLKLLRRPQNSGAASISYRLAESELAGQYIYRADRDDIDPITFQRTKNSPYDLVNISGSYQYNKWVRLHARVDNVFDRKYEEVVGYGTAGVSFYAGMSGQL
ncbi:MAG: TonB-dependent receptor [Bdellovibrionaceae bacterium]|nr:TonB-dependent receptor [Pseudobdellovibrionaceae bacterium]